MGLRWGWCGLVWGWRGEAWCGWARGGLELGWGLGVRVGSEARLQGSVGDPLAGIGEVEAQDLP